MKKLTAILMSLFLVFSLVACGNNQQTKDTTPEPSSEPVSETMPEPEKTEQPSETPSASQAENSDNTGDSGVGRKGKSVLLPL